MRQPRFWSWLGILRHWRRAACLIQAAMAMAAAALRCFHLARLWAGGGGLGRVRGKMGSAMARGPPKGAGFSAFAGSRPPLKRALKAAEGHLHTSRSRDSTVPTRNPPAVWKLQQGWKTPGICGMPRLASQWKCWSRGQKRPLGVPVNSKNIRFAEWQQWPENAWCLAARGASPVWAPQKSRSEPWRIL